MSSASKLKRAISKKRAAMSVLNPNAKRHEGVSKGINTWQREVAEEAAEEERPQAPSAGYAPYSDFQPGPWHDPVSPSAEQQRMTQLQSLLPGVDPCSDAGRAFLALKQEKRLFGDWSKSGERWAITVDSNKGISMASSLGRYARFPRHPTAGCQIISVHNTRTGAPIFGPFPGGYNASVNFDRLKRAEKFARMVLTVFTRAPKPITKGVNNIDGCGMPNSTEQYDHRDNTKTNDALWNLEWLLPSVNASRIGMNGRPPSTTDVTWCL